jgi:hypothetical protein
MTSYINYSRPGRVWLVSDIPAGEAKSFFYGVINRKLDSVKSEYFLCKQHVGLKQFYKRRKPHRFYIPAYRYVFDVLKGTLRPDWIESGTIG